jgi:hypothetical protein
MSYFCNISTVNLLNITLKKSKIDTYPSVVTAAVGIAATADAEVPKVCSTVGGTPQRLRRNFAILVTLVTYRPVAGTVYIKEH